MTALQLNAELFRAMGKIADDETLMKKVLNYVKRAQLREASGCQERRPNADDKGGVLPQSGRSKKRPNLQNAT